MLAELHCLGFCPFLECKQRLRCLLHDRFLLSPSLINDTLSVCNRSQHLRESQPDFYPRLSYAVFRLSFFSCIFLLHYYQFYYMTILTKQVTSAFYHCSRMGILVSSCSPKTCIYLCLKIFQMELFIYIQCTPAMCMPSTSQPAH